MKQETTVIDRSRLEKTYVTGLPSVFYKDKIRLAQVPLTGDSLLDSIVIHPRYVPHGMSYRPIEVTAFPRGRSVYILLDEPVEHEGESYPILNIKGVGAEADRDFVIHPSLWWVNDKGDHKWVGREKVHNFGRRFGSLGIGEGRGEYEGDVLKRLGALCSPYVGLNPLPKEICQRIKELGSGPRLIRYAQASRLVKTDIRMHLEDLLDDNEKLMRFEDIVAADIKMINAQFGFVKRGLTADVTGFIEDNRYIDGRFTDEDNYTVKRLSPWSNAQDWFSVGIITSTLDYLPEVAKSAYLRRIGEGTGLWIDEDALNVDSGALDRFVSDNFSYEVARLSYIQQLFRKAIEAKNDSIMSEKVKKMLLVEI